MSVFSVGGNTGFAIGPLFVAAVLAVTVLAAFPLTGLGLALRLRRPRRESTPPGVMPCNSAPRL